MVKNQLFIAACCLLVSLSVPFVSSAQAPGGARPFLGVRLGTTSAGQVRLSSILPGSPAERAGFEQGDLIVSIQGNAVGSPQDVVAAVQGRRVGDRLDINFTRAGLARDIAVELAAAPAPEELLRSFVGRPAPSWSLPRVNGSGQVSLSSLRGRVVLIYFWSIHCGVCRMSTPILNEWERTMALRGLSVVAIADDPLDSLGSSASVRGLSFPLGHDVDTKVGGEYWVSAVPTFFVIDQRGNVAYVTEGWYPRQQQHLEREISRLLGGNGP